MFANGMDARGPVTTHLAGGGGRNSKKSALQRDGGKMNAMMMCLDMNLSVGPIGGAQLNGLTTPYKGGQPHHRRQGGDLALPNNRRQHEALQKAAADFI